MCHVAPILDHCAIGPCALGWWRGPYLLPDACGIPGIYGPGRVALGHIPFYRAVECCDRACADPSNCPPRTRDTFEQAITLDFPADSATPMLECSPEYPRGNDDFEKPEPPAPPPSLRACSSAAKLGEVLPVRREQVINVTRTTTRFVTPGLPGRIIDLVV